MNQLLNFNQNKLFQLEFPNINSLQDCDKQEIFYCLFCVHSFSGANIRLALYEKKNSEKNRQAKSYTRIEEERERQSHDFFLSNSRLFKGP